MRFLCILLATVVASSAYSQDTSPPASSQDAVAESTANASGLLEPYLAAAVKKWESEIRKLEALDASQPHGDDAILFLGSSSIRRWETIAVDMAPYRVIKRGYGGSRYSDVAVFANRLMHPHQYRAMVIFVGNDVSGKKEDKSPDEVERLTRYVIGVSQNHQPHAPVLLIEVTPNQKRWAVWPQIRAVNARLREVALTTPNTYFIATAGDYLDSNGQPRNELFAEDLLHLNKDGYAIWSRLIRRRLDDVLRMKQALEIEPIENEN